MVTAEEIISHFGMQPLPKEGGYYVEIYRSDEVIPTDALPDRYSEERTHGTSILYLLTPDTFSALHRLTSDEIFHFYAGDPVTMLLLYPEGSSRTVTLGSDFMNGQKVQEVVGRNIWQGCFLDEGGKWALMGTTVAPGFEFADYEHGSVDELVGRYPDQEELIRRLTMPKSL
jgi:uncharacterized protein